MNKSSFTPSGNAEGPDKVDMSLDDIIRLNKKQKLVQSQKVALRRQRLGVRGRLAPGRRAGTPQQHRGHCITLTSPGTLTRYCKQDVLIHVHFSFELVVRFSGGGVNKPFRRRAQGVITGLAARKAALLKGVSPLNRPALNRANVSRAPARRSALFQRTRPFVSQRRHTLAHVQTQRRPYTQPDPRKVPGRVSNRPFSLRRKWNAPPVNEPQREARQATFLSRRGLKVHTQVQKTAPIQPAQRTQRTRPWRTPVNSSGILTVSIDNPGARTQPEPAHSWSLHPPPAVTPPTQNTTPEPERKKPKGVALQFDINSVGKQQTAMTLNERFRILKMKRVAAAQQNARGGRFVTVG